MNRQSEPLPKGLSLHNPVSCERGSPMLTQVAPERGRRESGGKVYGEVLGSLRGE